PPVRSLETTPLRDEAGESACPTWLYSFDLPIIFSCDLPGLATRPAGSQRNCIPADVRVHIGLVGTDIVKGLRVSKPMRLAVDAVARERELLRVLPVGRIVVVPEQRQTLALRRQPPAQT